MIKRGEELFNNFVDEIEKQKISEISVRRALKKYDVKSSKIDNVTPLRAKKMYSSILPRYISETIRYENGVAADKCWLQNQRRLFVWCALCYLYKKQIQISDMVDCGQCQKTDDFEYLREMFPVKQLDLIKFQIYSLIKKDNKNCKWKDQEDHLLKSLVEYFITYFRKQKGKNIEWSNVSKYFFSLSSQSYFRNAKQCRQRWLNHLDPKKTKGKWEVNQDRVLLNSVLEKGKKWSKIVQDLEGKKNEHMIKNRFKSLIHKKQKEQKWKKMEQCDIIKLILKDLDQRKDEQDSQQEQQSGSIDLYEQSNQQSQKNIMLEKHNNNISNFVQEEKNSKWPIIVQPSNHKDTLKENIIFMQDQQRDNPLMRSQVQVSMCGSKVDKQFVNNLFFNVNTPVADERLQSINLETRSPANIFMSPFPGGCWTPTIFMLDDTQGQLSPSMQLQDFQATAKSTFHQFLPDESDKRN